MYLDPQHWVYLAQTVGGGQADGETDAEEAAEDGVQQAQRHIREEGGGEGAQPPGQVTQLLQRAHLTKGNKTKNKM